MINIAEKLTTECPCGFKIHCDLLWEPMIVSVSEDEIVISSGSRDEQFVLDAYGRLKGHPNSSCIISPKDTNWEMFRFHKFSTYETYIINNHTKEKFSVVDYSNQHGQDEYTVIKIVDGFMFRSQIKRETQTEYSFIKRHEFLSPGDFIMKRGMRFDDNEQRLFRIKTITEDDVTTTETDERIPYHMFSPWSIRDADTGDVLVVRTPKGKDIIFVYKERFSGPPYNTIPPHGEGYLIRSQFSVDKSTSKFSNENEFNAEEGYGYRPATQEEFYILANTMAEKHVSLKDGKNVTYDGKVKIYESTLGNKMSLTLDGLSKEQLTTIRNKVEKVLKNI